MKKTAFEKRYKGGKERRSFSLKRRKSFSPYFKTPGINCYEFLK